VKRFARIVTEHPGVVLALVILLTAAAVHGIVDLRSGELRLRVDPAIERLLPEGDDERLFYDRAKQRFGNDQLLLLVLEADDVFRPDVLERVARITQRVEKVPNVQRVVSLASATQIEDRDGDVYVGPFYEEPPTDPAALAALREAIRGHPIYGSLLVSPDARSTVLVVSFDRISDREFVERRFSEELEAIAREEAGELPVRATGLPHVKSALSRTILSEMVFIVPSVLGIAALMCAFTFRTARGVALPIAAILVSVIWTLGAMGWSGNPFNLVSNIVPPLIITLGFASAMHVVSEYYEILHRAPAADAAAHRRTVAQVLEEMGLAVAVNGFTTVLGFLSLMTSRVTAVREFGLWASVGVTVATVVSLTLIPAVLTLLGPARRVPREAGEGVVDRIAERLAEFDVRNRTAIFALSLGILVVCAFGVAKIRISSGLVDYFFPDAPVRATYEDLNERLGGLGSFYVVIEADEDGAFARPENLAVLRETQQWIASQPEIGSAISLADPLMQLNRAFHGNDPTAFALPETAALSRQLILFGGDDVKRGLVDANFRTANILVRTKVTSSEPVGALLVRLEERLAQLPQRLRARPTGDLVLLRHSADQIARGQLESLGTAFVTIYFTLALLLTSFRVGLLALLPNLVPIAIYYGVLGLLDIPLSLSTSLIGAITLGIAVDDTVHYFARFALEARRLGDERRATVSTLKSVIRPVTSTTIGLSLGFLVLAFSDLRYQVQFGLLSAFTMTVAWFLEMTLSPALCSRVRLVTLWDLLRLDLGPEPHRSIPLFEGLQPRQARIFALMSRIVSSPAGTRLFAEGDRGDEMYVVVDGELTASTRRGDQRVEFSTMRRGDVVGEIAMFSNERTADVDVKQDARLLRFGEADLERLGRRYPRIAAKVYRNLNRILAGRVVTTARALR
jgi:predicted RND superfamily exporter protein